METVAFMAADITDMPRMPGSMNSIILPTPGTDIACGAYMNPRMTNSMIGKAKVQNMPPVFREN